MIERFGNLDGNPVFSHSKQRLCRFDLLTYLDSSETLGEKAGGSCLTRLKKKAWEILNRSNDEPFRNPRLHSLARLTSPRPLTTFLISSTGSEYIRSKYLNETNL